VNEYKPKISLRKAIVLAVIAIVLMAVAGWLLSRENFYQMFATIKNANHAYVALAITLYFLSIGIWASRWQSALSFIGCKIAFGVRYRILCASLFLNNITPGARIGGDPFGRVYITHRLENMSYSSCMASLVGERALTPLVVVSFFMAGLLLRFGNGALQLTVVLIVVWVLVALGMVFFPRQFFRKKIALRRINGIMTRVLGWFGKPGAGEEIIEGVESFYSSSYATVDRWKKVLVIGAWTLLIGALDVFRIYTVFLALGYQPQISMLLLASAVQPIVGVIPFLPGGLLLVEGSLLSVFALFGVPLNIAMAATVIERGISFVLSTIAGAAVFSFLGIKMATKPEVQG